MPEPRWWRRPPQIALLVFATGLACAAAGARFQDSRNRELVRQRFTAQTRRLTDQLVARLKLYEYGLRGARGVIMAAEGAEDARAIFRRYVLSRDMDREFPGARAFGFVRRVMPADLPDLRARARRSGALGFETHQLIPNAGEQAIMEYVEPLERNRGALGLDILSEPRRRAAAVASMAGGAATITAPITLVQLPGVPGHAFVIMLPVYRAGLPVSTVAGRDAATYGWTLVALEFDDVLSRFDARQELFTLAITDVDSTGRMERFHEARLARSETQSELATSQRRSLFGREWRFEFRPRPAFVTEQRLLPPATVFLTGAIAALLSAALLYLYLIDQQRKRLTREAQVMYATIVTNSSDAIVTEALDGVLTAWNSAAESIFGYTAAEVIGKRVEDFLLPPERRHAEQRILDSIRRGENLTPFETVRRRKDGTDLHVSVAAAVLTAPDGRIVAIAKTIRDISRLKDAERDLRMLNATLEEQVAERTTALETARRDLTNVLDALPSMVGYWDVGMVNRFANQAYRRWYGLEQAGMAGRYMPELLGADIFSELRERIEGALRGESQIFERRVTNDAMGGHRHWLTHYLPDSVDGTVRGFYVLSHDITALNESRQHLAVSEALLERTGRVAGVGGWRLDARTEVLEWTAETRRILDVTPEYQPTLEQALAFYSDTSRPVIEQAVADAIRDGVGWDLELEIITARGQKKWVRALGEVECEDGRPVRMMGAFQDISARRAVNDELERALHDAEAASAAKSAFLANTSHEIRTPLHAVVSLVYLLGRTALNHDQRSLVRKIDVAGQALLTVINDVLDLSKIEAGEMRLEHAAFDLTRLLRDLHDLMLHAAEMKQLEFLLAVGADVPQFVCGDATRVRQVLTNLVGNAIKFTETGGIELRVTAVACDAERVSLRFVVGDTGIGIPLDVQPQLFTPFTQADVSTTRRFGGTGLGLSIVRHLTGMMHGSCGMRSTLGVGSEFWAEVPFPLAGPEQVVVDQIPIATMRSAPETSVPRLRTLTTSIAGTSDRALSFEGLPGVRAMVVDDSDINLEVARRILEHEGADVCTCSSGREALALLQQSERPFDVILMDVQMPDMDGNEVTRRIREDLDLHHVPVIAVTAGASVAEQRRTVAAGMNGYLTKPIDPQRLLETVRQHIERRRGTPLARRAVPRMANGVHNWPRIDGITEDATADRFSHDIPLFLEMLQRLFSEFTRAAFEGIRSPAGSYDREAFATRMHRLRGSAGILGAARLQQLAGEAEQRCLAPIGPWELEQMLDTILASAADLARAAQPVLSAHVVATQPAVRDASLGLMRDDLRRLQELLVHQDLAALAAVDQLAVSLRNTLGATRFETMQQCVRRFEFARASELLRALGEFPLDHPLVLHAPDSHLSSTGTAHHS